MQSPAEPDSLTAEFVAAKRRFLEAGRQDLCAWADKELTCFARHERLPPYRCVPAIAKGTVCGEERSLHDYLLPIWHLGGDWKHAYMREGIADIEAMARCRLPCSMQSIDAHELALFTRGLRLGGGYAVTEARWEILTPDLQSVVLAGARNALHQQLQQLQSVSTSKKN